jgi:cell division protein FtsL
MSAKMRRGKGPRRPGRLRAVGWLLLLLVSLLMVTWRQTRGLALEGGLRELESERAVTETERVELVRRIEELRSRARIVRVARDRLDMHLPREDEIVFLPVDAGPEELEEEAR